MEAVCSSFLFIVLVIWQISWVRRPNQTLFGTVPVKACLDKKDPSVCTGQRYFHPMHSCINRWAFPLAPLHLRFYADLRADFVPIVWFLSVKNRLLYIVHPLVRPEINSLLFTSDNKSTTAGLMYLKYLLYGGLEHKFNSEQMREKWTYTHSGQNIDKQILKCHQEHIILSVCALITFTFKRNHSVYMLFTKRKIYFPESCLGSSGSCWTGQLFSA